MTALAGSAPGTVFENLQNPRKTRMDIVIFIHHPLYLSVLFVMVPTACRRKNLPSLAPYLLWISTLLMTLFYCQIYRGFS